MSSAKPVGYGRRHLGIALRELYDAFIVHVFDDLAVAGFDDLRPAHAQVFQHLKEEGVRLTALAEDAGVTPQSMGALVDDLERLGYVQRSPDPSDRRASLIKPTDRGRAEVAAARQVIARLEQQCARALGKRRYTDFLNNVDSLAQLLRQDAE